MGIPHVQNFAIPKVDVSTTSTTSYDLLGRSGVGGTVLNAMPWAGTVQRVLIGHSQDIGTGDIAITRYTDGTPSGITPGAPFPFVAAPGPAIEIINTDLSFLKDEGLLLEFRGDGVVNCALRITFQVEFDFV